MELWVSKFYPGILGNVTKSGPDFVHLYGDCQAGFFCIDCSIGGSYNKNRLPDSGWFYATRLAKMPAPDNNIAG